MLLRVILAGLLGLSRSRFSEAGSNIRFASDVPPNQRVALEEALTAIDTFPVNHPSEDLLTMMKIPEASPRTLRAWLEERFQYVVPQNFELKANTVTLKPNYAFPFPGILPLVEAPAKSAHLDLGPRVAMGNLGVGVYYSGKSANTLVGLKMAGIGIVPMTSPRVGVVVLGNGIGDDESPTRALKPTL